jgi:two-component system cell cycle response regulator DivK
MNPAARRQADEPAGDPSRALEPSPRAPSSRRQPRRRPVILIADDTADALEIYGTYFTSRGFSVVTAQDGAAAIQVALDHRPDVIVMDLAMPQFDGITATQRIKGDTRTRRTRVILLTGYPQYAIERDPLERGVDRFLTKPCLPEELERHVNELRRPNGSL